MAERHERITIVLHFGVGARHSGELDRKDRRGGSSPDRRENGVVTRQNAGISSLSSASDALGTTGGNSTTHLLSLWPTEGQLGRMRGLDVLIASVTQLTAGKRHNRHNKIFSTHR